VGCEGGLEDCWIKVAQCAVQRKDSLSLPFAYCTDVETGHILDVRLFKKSRMFTVYFYDVLPEPCINFRIEDKKILSL
jgi:hypothetical protein